MGKALSDPSKRELLDLYYKIVSTRHIPNHWKVAAIVPIPKIKNSSIASDYRPISLLSFPSKIFENFVASRSIWFLESKNLITQQQVGFNPTRSCVDAQQPIDYFIAKAISERNHVTFSLNFERALDRFGLHVILKIWKSLSIGPKFFHYVKWFMLYRRFRVNCNLSNLFTLLMEFPKDLFYPSHFFKVYSMT